MAVNPADQEYRAQEDHFIQDLVADLHEMVKQDPLPLYGYVAQQIIGILVSPPQDVYQAKPALPQNGNESQATHIWQTIVDRVADFCARTEPYTVHREQIDWVLLRINREMLRMISAHVLDRRLKQAPGRV